MRLRGLESCWGGVARMKVEIDLAFKGLLANANEIFWAGTKPPLSRMRADERILSPEAGFRLPPDYFERFEIVYLCEIDLGTIKEWPVVVDEALRLLAPGGVLVIRMSDSPLLSIHALKHQLYCWGAIAPYFEYQLADSSRMFAVRNDRAEYRRSAQQQDVSFGVVTDGRRPELLEKFVSSVGNLRRKPGQKVELLICGPRDLDLPSPPPDVDIRLISEPEEFREQGWITRKKNLIASQADHENLVVVHDRYSFPEDFLLQLAEYGFDFGVITCKQLTERGERTPDWVTLGAPWLWTPPAMLDYRDWTPYIYINGGIIIGKTYILRQCPWNDLLFWQQAEDVELTRRLQAAGHVPRFASCVTVISGPLRAGSLEAFDAIPWDRERYWLPMPPAWGSAQVNVVGILLGAVLDLTGGCSRKVVAQGVYLDEAWSLQAEGATLSAGSRGVLVIRLAWHPREIMSFDFTVASDGPVPVSVNGLPAYLETQSEDGRRLRLVCPPEAFRYSPVARLHFHAYAKGPLVLSQLHVSGSGSSLQPVSQDPATTHGSRFAPDDGLWSFVFAYLRNHKGLRRWYMRIKQSKRLRASPFARRVHDRLRKLPSRIQ